MTVDFPARCAELLAELGLNEADAPLSVDPYPAVWPVISPR